ncbi:tripartite motif-containing protein 54-like isoform X2 [Monodelphis domestica]|uniref:tripartite motif-containing protein 54-like isoform X2 n=1 Tax=Monodelphis domestica TaxID=13616 RepID=UPI0024E26D93|nr:tripartite motif-containing protein 54-like isoform X2 [Monodelphis domestica]
MDTQADGSAFSTTDRLVHDPSASLPPTLATVPLCHTTGINRTSLSSSVLLLAVRKEIFLGGFIFFLTLKMSLKMDYSSFPRDCHTMDTLERQLICPICLEMFSKPVVILPCQHNLCRKCANDIFQSRGTTLGSSGRFRCPSCRHEVVLDRHGVYGLQRNLLVENIIDIYKQESASPKPLLKPECPTCEEHEDEKINIYCVTCRVPTCSLCKVFGEHQSCRVAPLSDVYEQHKSELTDGIRTLVASNERIQTLIAELQNTCRNVEDNCKARKQTLCEKFERMAGILEERKEIMLQRVSYEQAEKTRQLRALSQAYEARVEAASKLVGTALQAAEEPQVPLFLQNAKVLIQKIAEAVGSPELETVEPGFDNMEHYAVDFNEEERALYQLDFIKIEEPLEAAVTASSEEGDYVAPAEEPLLGEDQEEEAAAPLTSGPEASEEAGVGAVQAPGTAQEEGLEPGTEGKDQEETVREPEAGEALSTKCQDSGCHPTLSCIPVPPPRAPRTESPNSGLCETETSGSEGTSGAVSVLDNREGSSDVMASEGAEQEAGEPLGFASVSSLVSSPSLPQC